MNPIKLSKDTIDRDDINRLIEWLQQEPMPILTKSAQTLQYESEYAKICGRKYGVFVNSGSSANLLAIHALIELNRLKNKKVIIPALCWITTISPVIQLGLEPILCDINLYDLSADLNHLEELFTKEKPAALFLVSILGIPPNMDEVLRLCDKHDVLLICDHCESQGAKYKGKNIESYGVTSSCSSYYGHITSSIEGGMVTTDDYEIYCMLKQGRSHGWSRDLDEDKKNELREKWGVSAFNELYTFYNVGYNLRSTDLNAFIGLLQLKKLPAYALNRYKNYLLYDKYLKNDFWKAPVSDDLFVSNLGYPVIHPRRNEIVESLQQNQVEVRPLISSSMAEQPFWIEKHGRQHLPNASRISSEGMYVPNHASLTEEEIKFVCDIINQFTNG